MKELILMADVGSLLDLDGNVFSIHSLDADNIVSQEMRFTIYDFTCSYTCVF